MPTHHKNVWKFTNVLHFSIYIYIMYISACFHIFFYFYACCGPHSTLEPRRPFLFVSLSAYDQTIRAPPYLFVQECHCWCTLWATDLNHHPVCSLSSFFVDGCRKGERSKCWSQSVEKSENMRVHPLIICSCEMEFELAFFGGGVKQLKRWGQRGRMSHQATCLSGPTYRLLAYHKDPFQHSLSGEWQER